MEVELLGLMARVDAIMTNGSATFKAQTRTSGCADPAYPATDTGLGHGAPTTTMAFLSNLRYATSDTDARKIVWNRNQFYYNYTALAVHNPRFAITLLREMWAVAGRHIRNDPAWKPPGSDY
jgi:hypothetical protein